MNRHCKIEAMRPKSAMPCLSDLLLIHGEDIVANMLLQGQGQVDDDSAAGGDSLVEACIDGLASLCLAEHHAQGAAIP